MDRHSPPVTGSFRSIVSPKTSNIAAQHPLTNRNRQAPPRAGNAISTGQALRGGQRDAANAVRAEMGNYFDDGPLSVTGFEDVEERWNVARKGRVHYTPADRGYRALVR